MEQEEEEEEQKEEEEQQEEEPLVLIGELCSITSQMMMIPIKLLDQFCPEQPQSEDGGKAPGLARGRTRVWTRVWTWTCLGPHLLFCWFS